jgi:hypothetical protein
MLATSVDKRGHAHHSPVLAIGLLERRAPHAQKKAYAFHSTTTFT